MFKGLKDPPFYTCTSLNFDEKSHEKMLKIRFRESSFKKFSRGMPPDPGPKKLSPLALATLASSVVKVWLRPCCFGLVWQTSVYRPNRSGHPLEAEKVSATGSGLLLER